MGASDWAAGGWAFAPAGAVTVAARIKTTLKDFVVFMVAYLKKDFCKRRIGPKTRPDKPTVVTTIRAYGSMRRLIPRSCLRLPIRLRMLSAF